MKLYSSFVPKMKSITKVSDHQLGCSKQFMR